ncbi:hypothetical protein HDU93_004325 [Gonapodya sp. JEL0774]|nr:hypothetical protein HDU93_004325 [Gonapodya sp. JEL0774]
MGWMMIVIAIIITSTPTTIAMRIGMVSLPPKRPFSACTASVGKVNEAAAAAGVELGEAEEDEEVTAEGEAKRPAVVEDARACDVVVRAAVVETLTIGGEDVPVPSTEEDDIAADDATDDIWVGVCVASVTLGVSDTVEGGGWRTSVDDNTNALDVSTADSTVSVLCPTTDVAITTASAKTRPKTVPVLETRDNIREPGDRRELSAEFGKFVLLVIFPIFSGPQEQRSLSVLLLMGCGCLVQSRPNPICYILRPVTACISKTPIRSFRLEAAH